MNAVEDGMRGFDAYMRGDLRTPEAVVHWEYYKLRLERRRFHERQENINWGEFARGSYQVAVNWGSRLVYRGTRSKLPLW